VPGYFPRVVEEDDFHAAAAGAKSRKRNRGAKKDGAPLNLFARILKDARDGESYFMTGRADRGTTHYVLQNLASTQGRARCYSFPYAAFELAILRKLREIKPEDILGKQPPDEVTALTQVRDGLVEDIGKLKDRLARKFTDAVADVLERQEARLKDITGRLTDATYRAAHPVASSWADFHDLLGVLDAAENRADALLRLRAALRRIVSTILIVIVGRGRRRLCAAQILFTDGCCREYLIYYRPRWKGRQGEKPPAWEVHSLADKVQVGELDLRRPEDAQELAADLEAIDLASLLDDNS
jgi:hypothetical protein